MITRITDDRYLNIFEHAWLIITAEFIIAMGYLKLYDIETDIWHPRRIVWTLCLAIALFIIFICYIVSTAAAIKYFI